MQISGEGKIGIALALLALFGAGAIVIWPQNEWIGWVLIAIAVVGFVILGLYHFLPQKEKAKVFLRVGENHLLEKRVSRIYGFQKTFLV